MTTHDELTRAEYETEIDATNADSFPASDPPSWTLGAPPWMTSPVAAPPVAIAIDPGEPPTASPHDRNR